MRTISNGDCCNRCELEALRKELSLAHAQSTWQAQESLTLERDAALSEARHGCEREKSSLCDKVEPVMWSSC